MRITSAVECEVRSCWPLKIVDVDRLLFGARVSMEQGVIEGKARVIFSSPSEPNIEMGENVRSPARFFGDAEDFNGAFLIALQALVKFRSAVGALPMA